MKKTLLTLVVSFGIIGGYSMFSNQGWLLNRGSSASQPSNPIHQVSGDRQQSSQSRATATPNPAKPLPVKVSALSPTTVCQGDSVLLSAPAGYGDYLWSNGKTTQTIYAKAGGHYTVRVAYDAGGPLSDTLGGYHISGVTVYPTGATGNDSVYLFLNPEQTCPLVSVNSFNSLVGASEVRAHLGVKLNGNNWNNVVAANDGNPNSVSKFKEWEGGWVKAMLPKNYNNVPSGTIEGLSFVLTGGPQVGGWFNKEGKVQPNCSDFLIPFPVQHTSRKSDFGVTVTMISNLAAPSIQGNPDTIRFCSGGSYTFNALGGNNNYLWSDNSVGSSLVVTQSGSYSVRQIVGACTSAASPEVVVQVSNSGLPSLTPTALGATSFCPGDSVQLDAGTLDPNQHYEWSNGDTNRITTIKTSGNYSVRRREGGCYSPYSSPIAVTVYQKPLPVPVTATGSTSICTGQTVTLSAPTGYAHYLWSNGATTRQISVGTSGHYTVRVAHANGCYSDTLSGLHISGLTVYPAGATASDSIYLFLDPSKTCPLPTSNPTQSLFGTNVIRMHSGATIGGNAWSNVVSTTNPAQEVQTRFDGHHGGFVKRMKPTGYYGSGNISALNFVLNGGNSTGGWFEREGKVEPGCGDFNIPFPLVATSRRSAYGVTVTVNDVPNAPTATANGAVTFCQGQSVRLTASGGVSGQYIWSDNSTADTLRVTTAGTYTVRSFAGACTSAVSNAITVTVTATAAPTATAQGPTTFCDGGSVVLSTAMVPNATYEWSNGETTRTITVKRSGNYTVRYYLNGCGTDMSAPVTVNVLPRPLPVMVTASGPTTFCVGDSVTLSAPAGFSQYLWSNGSTTQTIKVKSSGNYTVRVANANGCLSDTLSGRTVSGVTMYPVGAGQNDSVYLFVNPKLTCPLPSNSNSINNSSVVRMHSGATIGGNAWQNVVNTTNALIEPTTRFSQWHGAWVKSIVPSQFYSSNNVGGLNFILTGGAFNGGWFPQEGKVEPGCGDFGFGLPITATSGPSPFGAVVNVLPLPAAPSITGATTYCTGGNVTLSTQRVLGNNEVFEWSNAQTTSSVNVTAGTYKVRVKNNATGCISVWSNEITVTETPTPTAPAISAQGPTTFNVGGSVALVVAPTTPGGTTVWSNGQTGGTIVATTAGTYTAVTVVGTCTSAVSNSIVVTVNRTSPDLMVTNTQTISAGTYYDVTITSTGDLTLNGNLTVEGTLTIDGTLNTNCNTVDGIGNVRLMPGATLKICDPMGIAATGANGAIQNTGLRQLSTGANYVYNGASQFTGAGLPATVRSLSVSGNLIQSAPVRITHHLALNGGIYDLNNHEVVLASSASHTAYIPTVSVPTNLVNDGNFVMERWLDRSRFDNLGAWLLIGSPLAGQTVQSYTYGNSFSSNTYNNAVSGGSSFYFYNPFNTNWMTNKGFTKPTAPSQSVPVGTGVRLWMRNGSLFVHGNSTFRTVGSPQIGDFTFNNLQYCASGCAYGTAQGGGSTNGWNLIANPFPSAIDWTSAGVTRTNVENAIYVHDYINGRYESYVDGVGINGGSNLIPSSQGFFVRANGASPSLTISETAKTTSSPAFTRQGVVANVLRMRLTAANGRSDESALRFDSRATLAFDASMDAANFVGDAGVDLATLTPTAEPLAIDSRPEVNGSTTIDLALTIAGQGTLSFEGLSTFNQGYTLTLLNKTTGQQTPIQDGLIASVSANEAYAIVVNNTVTSLNNAVAGQSFSLYPNPAAQDVNILFAQAGTYQVIIRNNLGQVVAQTTVNGAQAQLNLSDLASGVYQIVVPGQGIRKLVKN